MFKYALKRVARGYRLTLALVIGVLVAGTFFGSMLMSADVLTSDAVSTALSEIDYDVHVVANNVTWTRSELSEVQSVLNSLPEVEIADRYGGMTYTHNATLGQSFTVVGMFDNSSVMSSLHHINGSAALAANETYVVASSVNASLLSIGEVLTVDIPLLLSGPPFVGHVFVNLTVAGFVDVSENTARLFNPSSISVFEQLSGGRQRQQNQRVYNVLLVDWEKTIAPLLKWYENHDDVVLMAVQTAFLCRLDRDTLINPYDLSGSLSNVEQAVAKIEDRTAEYNTRVTSIITPLLTVLSAIGSLIVLSFVAMAVPVIFMSWYSSTMLSDVSYNLRRREFGLLQTKGFSPKRIRGMLLMEAAIIGISTGALSVVLAAGMGCAIAGSGLESLMPVIASTPMDAVVIVIFTMILAVWSVRGPADRAASLEPLDALKQYVYIEERRQYRRLLPTIALLLGTYKIIMWALGINILSVLALARGVNLILYIVVAIWTPVDVFLGFVGPILFLYGLTKILLRGSQKFQAAIVSAARRFFGAFGRLATRNVRRNPVRNAALVFVLSLIVAYGVYSVGSLYSEADWTLRNMQYSVGSDVSVVFPAGYNMTPVVEATRTLDGVVSVTVEYRISLSTTMGPLEVRGINATEWAKTAFYENGWFVSGNPMSALDNFTGSKVMLSISVARELDLRVGNFITIRALGDAYRLEIVELVGYASPLEEFVGQFALAGLYPSFVPTDFLESAGLLSSCQPHLLVKTAPDLNGTEIEQQLASMFPDYVETHSMTSEIQELQENDFQMAGVRTRWVGILFALVLAVVGTVLVVGLTLKEKEYEVTLLGVRGFERRQVLKVLFGEVLVMVVFSLLLGLGTGLVQLFGEIANQSQNAMQLVRPRIVLDLLVGLEMFAIVMIVVIAALIPVLLASRLTEEKISVLRE